MPLKISGAKNVFYTRKILKKDNQVFLISTFCPLWGSDPELIKMMCDDVDGGEGSGKMK